MPQKVILIRHGETDYNKQHLCQGWIDVPLNREGKKQAKRLVKTLLNEPIDSIYSSDLKRTIQTAQPLARERQLEIHPSSYLRERHMGIFQDLSWHQIKKRYPNQLKKLDDRDDLDWQIPEGESWNQVLARVNHFLSMLYDQEPNSAVAIFTHGGAKRAILHDMGFSSLANNTYINNTDITIIEKDQAARYQIRTTTITPRTLQIPLTQLISRN